MVQTSSPKEEQATNDIDEKDTEYLKEFFTLPDKEEVNKVPGGWNPKLLKGSVQMFVFSSIYMLIIISTDEDFMRRITCDDCDVIFKDKFNKEHKVELTRLIRVFNNNIWEHKKSVK